jgi:prolyl-tRNA editing enzyme YbaK/EbsC (Cys-tRNA(Pro) deacylase)
MGARKVSFADADETRRITAMEIGGVTPIGLPPDLPVWVDQSVMECETIILGGGNRSSKIKVSPALFEQLPGVEVVSGLARQPG